jgi:large subunit ribosomal protein L13
MQKTHTVRASDIDRQWWLLDAQDVVLGRLASQAAHVLRGKHKPTFSPHLDNGDHVVIINASRVRLTGDKLAKKVWYRHSGYPGGLRALRYSDLVVERPEVVVEKAVKGMLPRNRLGRAMAGKLNVYAGPDHPHSAQKPQPLAASRIGGAVMGMVSK